MSSNPFPSSSYRCYIEELYFVTGHTANSADDLRLHKASTHVPTSFMRHKCGDCGKKFVILELLEMHRNEGCNNNKEADF